MFYVLESIATLTAYHYHPIQSHNSFYCSDYYKLQCLCYSYYYKRVILFQSVIQQKILIRIIPNFNTTLLHTYSYYIFTFITSTSIYREIYACLVRTWYTLCYYNTGIFGHPMLRYTEVRIANYI